MTATQIEYLSPKEASRLFVKQPTEKVVRYWIRRGVANWRDRSGPRIKLQAVNEGNRYLTTAEWVMDFKAACQNNVPDV